MHTELLRFVTKDGLVLHGLLARTGRRNRAVIINVFGMTGNFYSSERYPELHKRIAGKGIDLLLPENRGMGSVFGFNRSNGTRKFIGTAQENFNSCIHDIDAAVTLASRLGYRRIILQGHSTGCQKIAYYQYKRKDRRVAGLVLLSPTDDYNLAREDIGDLFESAVTTASREVRRGNGTEIAPNWISYYSYNRFLSYANPANAEARIFNYESNMREFGSIRKPILAVFGGDEENALKPVAEYVRILERRTGSKDFSWRIINGADHGFHGKEGVLADAVSEWAAGICSARPAR